MFFIQFAQLRGSAIKQLVRRVAIVIVASIGSLYSGPPCLAQVSNELELTARARIEQARASIVVVIAENESAQTVAQAIGFFVRNDLVATDMNVPNTASRVSVSVKSKEGKLKVLSRGNYFLPYVLLEKQSEVLPLRLADSERVAVNDSVYMLGDPGQISAGSVTGTTTLKRERAFLISLPINSNNKGAPIFNREGEVIGIAGESPDGHSAGLAFPSSLLAQLKHLGEPGVGAGSGDGYPVGSTTTNTPAVSRVDTKPVRLSSPALQYTEAARNNNIQGTVILRVLVGEDGKVQQVRVVRGLPDGLTEQAIAAARQTKFKPAMKDGKPVPYWVALEMEFNIR